MALYAGIENEFTLVSRGKKSHFAAQFHKFHDAYNRPHTRKYDTCIRTEHGGSIYADGAEPETCTPPIRIEKGFATRTATALFNARHDLVTFISGVPNYNLTGFSMHYNITRDSSQPYNNGESYYMPLLAVPLSMFALTPNSVGINLRGKTDVRSRRFELLGDHIPDEDQVKALLLLYAGMMYGVEEKRQEIHQRLPQKVFESFIYPERTENLVSTGRSTKIELVDQGQEVYMTAQECLEQSFSIFKDNIMELATPDEMILLNKFITGKRELEIDKQERYEKIRKRDDDERAYRSSGLTRVDKKKYRAAAETDDTMAAFLGRLSTINSRSKEPLLHTQFNEWDDLEFTMLQNKISEFRLDDRRPLITMIGLDSIAIAADVAAHIPDDESMAETTMELSYLIRGFKCDHDFIRRVLHWNKRTLNAYLNVNTIESYGMAPTFIDKGNDGKYALTTKGKLLREAYTRVMPEGEC